MDPHEVFTTDREKFDRDLELLIDTAAAAVSSESSSHATSPSTTPTSPPSVVDPRLRKRSLPQAPASKKVRFDVAEQPTLRSQAEVTGANNIPLGSKHANGETWNTLRNAVHRQWDSRKDDLTYEKLVEKRRAERLTNVDRYIPGDPSPPSSPPVRRTFRINKPFPFGKLPEKLQEKILALVLVGESPLVIDFTWLRPFVHGHCRVPSTTKTVTIDGVSYNVPVDWTKLIDVSFIIFPVYSGQRAASSRFRIDHEMNERFWRTHERR